ncbi:MAG: alpha/beta hydrolase [Selenomonadaceae bacterium]|nr:alpha/beta hydrolase [Selenomonadaceae bacterium]
MWKRLFGLFFAAAMACPLTAAAQTQNLEIDGDHGKLSAVIQRPDNQTKYPMVMLLHGFTGNKEQDLLRTIANNLEAQGVASIRFDFNGHGASEGSFQDMTVLNEIEDAKKVYAYVSSLPEVTSVSIAGHSQGGVVTSMIAGQLGTDKVKAIALMAPAAVLREDAIRGNTQGAQYDPLNPPEYIELKRPGRDSVKIGRNYFLTARDLPIYEVSAAYQGPALMVHGTGDVIVPYTYSQRYAHIYINSEIILLPGFDHGFTQDVAKTAKIVSDYFVKQLLSR